jgi:DNA-binding beta-propeller fold protein YncE
MKTYLTIFLIWCTVFVWSAHAQQPQSHQLPMEHMSGLLRLVETIPLPTEGYMDHLTVDAKGQRLFLSGEDNRSFFIVDLRSGKVVHETKGLSGKPRKPFYIPESNEIWVDLSDGHVVAIDGTTYEQSKVVDLPGHDQKGREADNAAYDPAAHLYYAAFLAPAGQKGSIEIVDTKAAKHVGSIPVDGADPEGLAIEPSGKRLYVGMGDIVNGESKVEVIDLEKRAVVAAWPLTGGPVPHTAGLDAAHHRLFMGSRVRPGHRYEPGKLVVINTETGKVVQALDSVGGADEIQLDPATGRIYFVGSTGTIAVFKQLDPDHYQLLGKVPTGAIAKTALWVPELKRVYVAVPKHLVETPPYGENDYITEEAHLMVFDSIP